MKLFQNDQFTLSREDAIKLGDGLDRMQRLIESVADRVYNLETIGKLQNESSISLNDDFQAANDQIKKISTVMVENVYPSIENLDNRAKKLELEHGQIHIALTKLLEALSIFDSRIKKVEGRA